MAGKCSATRCGGGTTRAASTGGPQSTYTMIWGRRPRRSTGSRPSSRPSFPKPCESTRTSSPPSWLVRSRSFQLLPCSQISFLVQLFSSCFPIVSFCSEHVSTYQGLRGIPVARFPKRQNDAGMTGRARVGSVGSGSSSGVSSNSGAARSWSLLDPSPEEKDRPSSPVVSLLSQFLKLLVEFLFTFHFLVSNVSFSSPGLQSRLQWDPRQLGVAQRGRPQLGSRDQGQDREEEEGHRQS